MGHTHFINRVTTRKYLMTQHQNGPGEVMAKDKNESVFDVKKIREFIELMEEHDLSEVDLKQSDQRIRLRRGGEPVAVAAAPAAVQPLRS